MSALTFYLFCFSFILYNSYILIYFIYFNLFFEIPEILLRKFIQLYHVYDNVPTVDYLIVLAELEFVYSLPNIKLNLKIKIL
jgi:hypothetical protein